MIEITDDIFDEIYQRLIPQRKIPERRFDCVLMSSITASFFCRRFDQMLIIDSDQHSVAYDGKDTWDLSLGIVFRNYKYPEVLEITPDIIPVFKTFFKQDEYDLQYSDHSLSLARQRISIKKVEIDGTTKKSN